MRKLTILLAFAIIHLIAAGQQPDSLSIETCLRLAAERNPLNRQKAISEAVLSFKIKNLNTSWLPAAVFNAQAQYNSETIDFSDLVDGLPVSLPTLPLDQYKVWADINQQVYDGGLVKARKSQERIAYEADLLQTETDLLTVKQQVNQVFFFLLLSMKNAEIMTVSLNDLSEKERVINTGVENGVVLREVLLDLQAEQLKLEQKIYETEVTKQQLYTTLSILLDTAITETTRLSLPSLNDVTTNRNSRPEFLLFAKQKENMDAGKKLIAASAMPRVFIFSQAAYGRPGYNMISNEFHSFYTLGIGMKWNLINYGNNKRQKLLLDLQKDAIDIREENFSDLLSIQLENGKSTFEKFDILISKDEQILSLRKTIAELTFAKLTKGIVTSNEYLSEQNAELVARLQLENHKILKWQAAYDLFLLQGNM
jgi:outer membrane protein TolC